jgi:hypothetical protein
MGNSLNQCCTRGCGTLVPAQLEAEGLCVPHFLLSAEEACTEIRHETAADGSSDARRAEIESYLAASAVKLAHLGTGSVRLSDEVKKRVLTTFLTLMILRENLDRAANRFVPRQRTTRTEVASVSAAARV